MRKESPYWDWEQRELDHQAAIKRAELERLERHERCKARVVDIETITYFLSEPFARNRAEAIAAWDRFRHSSMPSF
jgi:hypothetical protein